MQNTFKVENMVIFWSFDEHILVLHPSRVTKSRKQQMAEFKKKK